MKNKRHKKRKTNSRFSEGPPWFRRLVSGTLLGVQKDKLILQILQCGGAQLLEERSGIRFSGRLRQIRLSASMEELESEPTIKTLFSILRDAESMKMEQERDQARAALLLRKLEKSDRYAAKKKVLMNNNKIYGEVEIWRPK